MKKEYEYVTPEPETQNFTATTPEMEEPIQASNELNEVLNILLGMEEDE